MLDVIIYWLLVSIITFILVYPIWYLVATLCGVYYENLLYRGTGIDYGSKSITDRPRNKMFYSILFPVSWVVKKIWGGGANI